MVPAPRDHRLIDQLEPRPAASVDLTVWRVCHEDRDPCNCSRPKGRWDDGSFDALYTAEEADGAIAEMFFHLRRGQPVFPSKVRFELHELTVRFDRLLDLSDREAVARLGVDMARYGRLTYGRHNTEYPRTQEIGEVAHFLEFDGLRVPSARWDCENIVVFCDKLPPENLTPVRDHGLVDWAEWQARNRSRIGG